MSTEASDILLEIERDPDVWKVLDSLTDEQKDMLLSEMSEMTKNLQDVLALLSESLDSETGILNLVESVGNSISSGEFSKNIGTGVIEWPEKP
jgi:hypothetical protein